MRLKGVYCFVFLYVLFFKIAQFNFCRLERQTAMLNWSSKTALEKELQKFTESKEYTEFINSNNEEFKLYPITLKPEDLEGIELNNQVFWVLEKITEGLEEAMK